MYMYIYGLMDGEFCLLEIIVTKLIFHFGGVVTCQDMLMELASARGSIEVSTEMTIGNNAETGVLLG